MDLIRTRQLGIEFERRLQTLNENFVITKKLDTETIYAYLNEAQRQVFNRIYNTILTNTSNQEQIKYFSSTFGDFIVNQEILYSKDDSDEDNNTAAFILPDDFLAYLRSTSVITTSYKSQEPEPQEPEPQESKSQESKSQKSKSQNPTEKRVQNIFLRHEDFSKYINEYFDEKIILRRPIAVINAVKKNSTDPDDSINAVKKNSTNSDDSISGRLMVHYDKYTTLNNVFLYYYRCPKNMDLLNNVPCEMPEILFEDIVETAVLLYLTYSSGSFVAKNKQQKQEQNKQDDKNAEQQ